MYREPIKNYLPYPQKYVTSPDDIITLGIQTSLSLARVPCGLGRGDGWYFRLRATQFVNFCILF